MKGWARTTLGDACEIVSGATPSTAVGDYWDGDISWATPKDLSELDGTRIAATARTITEAGLASCSAVVLPPGSVLFSSRAPIGHVAINTVPMATNQGFKSFIPKPELLHAPFLYWWLRTNRPYLESLGNGATFKEVSKAIVAGVTIPVPPLSEQRRIAEILGRAEALRAKRRAALAQIDGLTQAIFFEMFGDLEVNSMAWPAVTVGEATECLDRFRSPVRESERLPGPIPYFGANGQQGWIDRPLFNETLILVAEDGGYFDEPNRGVAYRVDGPSWVNNHAHALRPRPGVVDPEFLHRALKHFDFRPYISGTTRSKLTQGQLSAIRLPTPPLALQRSFASRAAAVDKLKAAHRASLAQLDSLFASLQHRAFRGKL